jgi:tetratricopeptide (TPR) repeat protein
MDPNSDDKLYILLQLGRFADAEGMAREVIAKDPESSSGYYYLAQALLLLDRFQEALEVSDRVLALAPDHWYAHTQRSALLQNVERPVEAVEAAETAMRLDQTEPMVHLRLAAALSIVGRIEASEAVISSARHLFPDNPDIVYQTGLVALGKEDMDAVAEAAKQGLALAPTKPGFHLLAGLAAGHQAENQMPDGPMKQGRFREADLLLADAVRMDPTNATFRRLRKCNARDSRTHFMVKLMTGWLFGMVIGVVFLPQALAGVVTPCWCWLVLPVVIWLWGLVTHGLCPDFSLVIPLGWFDVVSVPLPPEERRKGYVNWLIFLTVTAAALFIPMLLMRM